MGWGGGGGEVDPMSFDKGRCVGMLGRFVGFGSPRVTEIWPKPNFLGTYKQVVYLVACKLYMIPTPLKTELLQRGGS